MNPKGVFPYSRLRVLICSPLVVAALVAALVSVGPARATARPTPTPRPRPTFPPPMPPEVYVVQVAPDLHVFIPSTVYVRAGETVRWIWYSNGHSVTSGTNCTANGQFCSPNNVNCSQGIVSNNGTMYEVTFYTPGTYYYFCAAHCAAGMTGVIQVVPRSPR